MRFLLTGLIALIAVGCDGRVLTPWKALTPPPPGEVVTENRVITASQAARVELRRLTQSEFNEAVFELLGEDRPSTVALLPADPRTPFDNDYTHQAASQALVEGLELLVLEIAERLVADSKRRDAVIGCVPEGPGDTDCFRTFVTQFGRRAFRRPLTDAELTRYLAVQTIAVAEGNFNAAVEVVIRAMFQEPSFLYRVELGTPVEGDNGLFKLTDHEIATRLSFLLWGSTPSEWLLALADEAKLSTPEEVRAVAQKMLGDTRAQQRVHRFHALWLGYEQLPHEAALSAGMQAETRALVQRVIFDEKRPWQDLLRFEETFLTPAMATHYGLPVPPAPAWVPYGTSGRRGLLSHGSILSAAANADDTSPTKRGKFIRERLFCQEILPPPPEAVVDLNDVTTHADTVCKWDRYAVHRAGGCASCHELMDPVGFGLENYDQQGIFRTHDKGLPQCTIAGEGRLTGVGNFKGPAELSELMIASGELTSCLTKQVYRFAGGRFRLDGTDQQVVKALAARFANGDVKFDELLLDLVSSDAFLHRRESEL